MLKLFIQKYGKSLVIYIVLLCSMLISYQEIKAQSAQKKVLEIPAINQGEYNDCVTASFYMAIQAVNPKIDESVHQIIHQIKEYDGIFPKIIPSHSLLNNYIKKRTGVEAIHLSCSTAEIPLSGSLPCVDKIKTFIKKNINDGKPIVLASTGWLVSASGHAVIVVGYDGDDYYYIHNPGAGDSHPTGINQRVNIHKDVYNNKLLGDYSKYVPGPASSASSVIHYTASVIPKPLALNRSSLNATVENNAFAFASPGAGKEKIDFKVNRKKPELYDFKDTAGQQYDSIPEKYKKISIGTTLNTYQIYNSSNTDKIAYLKIDIGREDATQKLNTMISDRATIPAHNYGYPPIGQISNLIDITSLKETDKQVDCYFKVSFYDENDSLFHQRIIRFKLDPGHFDFIQTKLIQCNEYELSLFDIQVPKTFQKVVYEFENKDTGFKDAVETTNKDGKVSYIFPQIGTFKVTAKVLVGGNKNIYQQTETEITIKKHTVDFNSSNEGNKYTFKSSGGCQLEDVSYNWEITDSADKEVYTKNNDTYVSHTFTESGNYTVTLKAVNNKSSKINGINSKKITVNLVDNLSSMIQKAFDDRDWAKLYDLLKVATKDEDKKVIVDYLRQIAQELHRENTIIEKEFKSQQVQNEASYKSYLELANKETTRLETALRSSKHGSAEYYEIRNKLDDHKKCMRATEGKYKSEKATLAYGLHVFQQLEGSYKGFMDNSSDYKKLVRTTPSGFFTTNDVKQIHIGYDLNKSIPRTDYAKFCSSSNILVKPPQPYIQIRASKTNARAGEVVELKAFLLSPPDGEGGRIVHIPDSEFEDTEIISWTGRNLIPTHGHQSNRYESSRSFMATETGEYVIKATADGYKSASVTISVGGVRTSGEILGLDENREFFGNTKEITYLARTSSGNAQVTGINYSQSIRWDSSPELSFNPQETKGGGEDGIKTRVTFSRMLNPTKIWAEIFWQYKDSESKVKSPVREVEVVSPDFSLSFNPPPAQARVGEPLIVTVESQPRVPNNLIEYRWVEPTDHKELENGVIEIIPKDNKPIDFHVIARVPGFGDVVNDNIKGQYIPGAHKVVASLVGPKYDKDSQEWSEAQKGLVKKKPLLVTGQEIVATVIVEDFDNEKVTFQWESNDGCSIHHGQYSRDVTVYRNEPGDCILKVTAYDKDKNALGTDNLTISISEQDTSTVISGDTSGEIDTPLPGDDSESQQEEQDQAQQEAKNLAVQEALSEAQEEASKGNFDKAITAAEKASVLDPTNKEIKEQIQAIKDRKEKTSTVIEEVKASLTQNDFEKAEALIKQLEKEFPDSSIAHDLNTELFTTKKNFVDKALTESKAYIKRGEIEAAISNLEKAVSVDPYNKELGTLLDQSKDAIQKINSLHDQYKQAMSVDDYKKADAILKEMQAVNRYHPDVVAAQSALYSEGQQKRSDLANKLYEVDKLISQGEIDQAITVLETTLTETESVNEATNIRTDVKTKLEYLLNKKNIADISLKEAERLINAGYKYYHDANRLADNALLALPTYKPAIAMKERMNVLFAQQREDLNKQNQLSQEAFKYLNNCDYNKAVDLIEQAKALNPDNIEIAKNAYDINNKRKAFLQSLNRVSLYIMKGDTNLAQIELDKHKNTCNANSDYTSVQESFDKYRESVKKEVDELLTLITDAIKKKDIAGARMNFNKIKARKDLPEGAEPVLRNFEKLIDDLEKQLNFVVVLDKFAKQPMQGNQSCSGGVETKIFDNFNTAGCGATSNAKFNLSKNTYITRIELWWNWQGETSINYRLTSSGRTIKTGILKKSGCDLYKKIWCLAVGNINMSLPAGQYSIGLPSNMLCQNAGSGRNGFIKVYSNDSCISQRTTRKVQPVKTSPTQTSSQPKTIHIVFKNQSGSPVHFYGMGQKASSANKVMPGKQVSSSVRMAIPDVKYYAGPTDMPKKAVSLLLNTLKQGETITFIYNAAGHFYRSH